MPDSQPSQNEASPSQPTPPGDPQPALDETKRSDSPTEPSVSDVVLADEPTGGAPSFRKSGPPRPSGLPAPLLAPPTASNDRPAALLPGAHIDDFQVVQTLGRGAFGHVYLVRQLSLDRLVALKVSANRGSEGRTMARLEHRHIVQVFSETVDRETNQRLLCMQLVSGIGLEKLITALHPPSDAKTRTRPPRIGPAATCSRLSIATHPYPACSTPRPSKIAKRWKRWTPSKPSPGSAAAWPKHSISPTTAACCIATSNPPTSSSTPTADRC